LGARNHGCLFDVFELPLNKLAVFILPNKNQKILSKYPKTNPQKRRKS
jgi:hypothetical protein